VRLANGNDGGVFTLGLLGFLGGVLSLGGKLSVVLLGIQLCAQIIVTHRLFWRR
jgi:hypothetical protein